MGPISRFAAELSRSTLCRAVLFASALSCTSFAQSPLRCLPSATNLINHAEGLAEPSGDIFLNCSGGTAGTAVNTNISIAYTVPITNRLNNTGYPDATLMVNSGSGPVSTSNPPILTAVNTLTFNGVAFTLGASGSAQIYISNVRLAMAIVGANHPVTATISTNSLAMSGNVVTVATANTGLYATFAGTGIANFMSQLPTTLNWANLIATGTNFASTRVTAGFGGSFSTKDTTSDAGTRFLIRYSNFTPGATVYLPDYVTGNDSMAPTAAGDLGGTQSPGVYRPGTLLLARVIGADSTGVGGAPLATAASFGTGYTFGSVTQVPLTGGAGTAVYEVIDANPNVLEYAQFPTFVGLAPAANQPAGTAIELISFAPTSAASTATPGAPVPRFAAANPPNDCSIVGDCSANYLPVLSAMALNLQFSVSPTGNVLSQTIQVNNTGGGFLAFNTAIAYQGSASGWLTVTNQSGSMQHTTLSVTANPAGLAQGTYQATVTINAGNAGTASFTYTFTVGPPQITVSSAVNAASFQAGPLVPGSLATLKGTNFTGKAVSVTFNGIAGTVLFSNAQQINVQVPAALASNTSAQVVVTVDGDSSQPITVQLANINPGIFGVLNQDNTVNSASNPAPSGTVVQIFATGLISPVSSGTIVVGLANQGIPTLYSGAMPNGLQQVNAQLPSSSISGSNVLVVCGTGTGGQLVCSPAVTLYLK